MKAMWMPSSWSVPALLVGGALYFAGRSIWPKDHSINQILAAALAAAAIFRLFVLLRDGSGYFRVRSTAGIDPADRLRDR
jgi:hypothetical protein